MKVYVVYTMIYEWDDIGDPEPVWELMNTHIEGVRSTVELAAQLISEIEDKYVDSGFKLDSEVRVYMTEEELV